MSARENLLRKSCRAPADNHFIYVSHRQHSCGKKDLYQRFLTTERVTLSVTTWLTNFWLTDKARLEAHRRYKIQPTGLETPMPATPENRIRRALRFRPSLANREGRNNSGTHAAESREASGIFQKIEMSEGLMKLLVARKSGSAGRQSGTLGLANPGKRIVACGLIS